MNTVGLDCLALGSYADVLAHCAPTPPCHSPHEGGGGGGGMVKCCDIFLVDPNVLSAWFLHYKASWEY